MSAPPRWARPLQDVSSTEAAIIYTLEPVLGAGLAYGLLGERWNASGWAGAGLIIGACLVAQASAGPWRRRTQERQGERGRSGCPMLSLWAVGCLHIAGLLLGC